MVLDIRAGGKWDCVALGEVMLRFDPGTMRVRTARRFDVWEGGGEYNVARALRKVFGKRAAIVTALPKNELGALVEDLILQGGVDMRHVLWREADGIGRDNRVGLNFTERGFGIRAPLGVSDRAHSAASNIRPGEVNWQKIFGEDGVRWFHTGGIFAGLAPNTAEVALEAVQAARRHGTIVSYDLNFRASLWQGRGGEEAARKVNRAIAPFVDVMFGNEEDLGMLLGIAGPEPMQAAMTAFPDLKVIAGTHRGVQSATRNDWSAVLYAGGVLHRSIRRDGLEIFDRVGGGDAFAAGVIYGLLEVKGQQAAVDYGAAHGALAMTTPGDSSMASLAEVEAVVAGKGARAVR
jgi:2-dehydro-3-deoxygluconokinase